jgi:hypothetical protein
MKLIYSFGMPELGDQDPYIELYDLSADLGETKNIAAENQAKARELADLLRGIQETGKSR